MQNLLGLRFFSRQLAFLFLLLFLMASLLSPTEAAKTNAKLDVLASGLSQPTINWIKTDILTLLHQKYPGLELNITPVGWGERVERITILFAGGTPPDIFMTGGGGILTEALMGFAYPVESLLRKSGDLDRFFPGAFDNQRVNGVIYGIPWRALGRGIAYNKRLFAEAGLNPSQAPDTWDKMLLAARRTTRTVDNSLVQTGFDRDWKGEFPVGQDFGSFIYQAGGELITPDRRKAQFNTAAGQAVIEFQSELFRRTNPLGTAGRPGGFTTGSAAMTVGDPGVASAWLKAGVTPIEELGLSVLRANESSRPAMMTWYDGFAIGSQTQHADIAYDLIMTMLSRVNAVQLAELQDSIPPLKDIGPGMRDRLWYAVPWYEGLAYSVGWPVSIESARLTRILSDNIRKAIDQSLAPKAALVAAEHEWNVVLQDWWAARDSAAKR